jgi:hypothetical protein
MSHIEPLNGSKTNERHTSLESSHILLYDLLKRNAPSAHWIRGLFASHFVDDLLLTDLPDPSVSVAQYSGAAVQALARHHIINDSFLSYLGRELPHEQNIINDIRRLLSLPMRIEEIVSFDVLMDNWAYEDVAELYADGPKDDVVGFLSVGEEELSWRREGWTGVALESLLAVLSGIVLRDRFFVEERYIGGWLSEDSPILGLHAGGVLCPFPEPDELWKIRSPLYRDLFHTPALKRWHQKNSLAMRETGTSSNEYEAAVTWGAVGYLARSAAIGVTYMGHPTRRRFLAQTPFVDSRQDAAILTLGTLDAARRRYLADLEETTALTLGLVVPPLLVNIIEESKTPEDLVLVALQFRERYRELRRWLAIFQKALYSRDFERMMECHATIKAVKTSLEGPRAHGSLRHDIASRVIHTLSGIHRPAAVILERLARTRSGEAAIDRLLELFGISGTLLETPVLTHLRVTMMQPASV